MTNIKRIKFANLLIIILFVLPFNSHCFYKNSTYVYEFQNVEDFDSKLFNSTNDNIWIVQFYVTQSSYCKKFITEYERAGKALNGFVKFGAFNVAKSIDIVKKYNVNVYPTLKIFNHEKDAVLDYSFDNEYNADTIVLDCIKAIRKKVDNNLKIKLENVNENIIQLYDDNFVKNVLNTEDVWLIVFYADDGDGDGNVQTHVVTLLNDLSNELSKPVKIGAIASDNLYTRSNFDINDLPKIVYLPFGVQTKKIPSYYDGPLTTEHVVEFVESEYTKMPAIKPNGFVEIDDEDNFYKSCEKTNLCVIVFLPELRIFSHPKRELYYVMFKELLDEYKYTKWLWFWCEYGKIPNLEIVLGVDEIEEPIVSALEMQHSAHSLLRGPFAYDQLKEFLENARIGVVEHDHVFVDDIYSDGYNKDEL